MISQVPFGSMILSSRTSLGSQFLVGSPQHESSQLKILMQRDSRNTVKESDFKTLPIFTMWGGDRDSAGQLEFPNLVREKQIWRPQVGLLGLQQVFREKRSKMAVAGSRFLFSIFSSFSPWEPGRWLCHWSCYSKHASWNPQWRCPHTAVCFPAACLWLHESSPGCQRSGLWVGGWRIAPVPLASILSYLLVTWNLMGSRPLFLHKNFSSSRRISSVFSFLETG